VKQKREKHEDADARLRVGTRNTRNVTTHSVTRAQLAHSLYPSQNDKFILVNPTEKSKLHHDFLFMHIVFLGIFGRSKSHSLSAPIKNGVVLAHENVPENPEWAPGWGHINANHG